MAEERYKCSFEFERGDDGLYTCIGYLGDGTRWEYEKSYETLAEAEAEHARVMNKIWMDRKLGPIQ